MAADGAVPAGLAGAAALALHRIKPDKRLVTTLLEMEKRIPGTISANVFGEMGPLAKEAVPWLVKQMRHEWPSLGQDAAAALLKIDPATARRVGAW